MPRSGRSGGNVPGQVNMIGEGTVIEGTLRAQSDVRISGRIVGRVEVEGKVMLAQEGVVEGEIVADDADVAGTVQGDLVIAQRLTLTATARVEGNLATRRLVVEEGAEFQGQCEMGETVVQRKLEGTGLGGEPADEVEKEPAESAA